MNSCMDNDLNYMFSIFQNYISAKFYEFSMTNDFKNKWTYSIIFV